MINSSKKSPLNKSQLNIVQELASHVDKQIHIVFERKMDFIITVNDPKKDKNIGFRISNLDSEEVFQAYVDNFRDLKNYLSKDVKIEFTRKLLSNILETTEEKKACFYWLLDELHGKDNVHSIKS